MFILPIRTRAEFLRLSKEGRGCFTSTLIFISNKTPDKYTQVTNKYRAKEFVRVGFTISRKIDKAAVVRNRIKRQLREAFKQLVPDHVENHTDYVIIARKFIVNKSLNEIKSDLQKCLEGKADKGFPKVIHNNKS